MHFVAEVKLLSVCSFDLSLVFVAQLVFCFVGLMNADELSDCGWFEYGVKSMTVVITD